MWGAGDGGGGGGRAWPLKYVFWNLYVRFKHDICTIKRYAILNNQKTFNSQNIDSIAFLLNFF